MKHTFNNILAGGAILLTAAACTGDYLDINSNQSQPGDLSADGFALVSSMTNICSTVSPSDVNCTQFVDCLLGGTLGGYFSDGANFVNSYVRNNAPDNWTAVFLKDSKIISTLYTNISMVEGYCEQTGEVVPLAVAQVIKVAAMNRVTDCYGPIPYSAIGFEGAVKTPYDSQEEVYNKFFEELQAARQILLDNKTAVLSPLVDKVYSGDVTNWIRFANSLQLRLALRISYANPTLAKAMAEDAVNPANGGVIETNEQNATWKNYATSTNSMRTAIMYNDHDTRPSAEIACYLNGFKDPRISSYLTVSGLPNTSYSNTPTQFKDANGNWLTSPEGVSCEYIGIRRGWATFDVKWSINFSDINFPGNTPALWMNASEVCFLRAEGAAVFGWDMGGTAESFYNNGVTLSFENCGVKDLAEAYLADNTSVPAQFYDPTGNNPWNGQIPAVTIKWDDSLTPEQKQQKIITQKWLANWTLGNEAWADYRRTGYPFLIPVAYSGAPDVNINRGPQRLPYPSAEYTDNPENLDYAIKNYLGGQDNWSTKLWWACKPGL
ncbi:MAG: SusD/RagB family nutrient-binding outer membrane lipoprotein [Bacteroides sp.]|nr:SusD/RagB family nutrient-binding outer membrane lipoprotein [Bacteroides sp.]MBD5350254.1 SusD/RagB family nutrient-binding outer membrane lipoprotein [Bacteroides sp.]MBD5350844.1 SusD/RagB family nutrient-binding outer membrane lipoprotein [Bacteroides sp.]MBD5421622.1 SusD/RagB family nutrient-binding outer membrane lipoprotein [Bacteroides sp.]